MNLNWVFEEIAEKAKNNFFGSITIVMNDGAPTMMRIEETRKPPVDLNEKK